MSVRPSFRPIFLSRHDSIQFNSHTPIDSRPFILRFLMEYFTVFLQQTVKYFYRIEDRLRLLQYLNSLLRILIGFSRRHSMVFRFFFSSIAFSCNLNFPLFNSNHFFIYGHCHIVTFINYRA